MKKLLLTLTLFSLLLPLSSATADTPEEKGQSIAREAYDRDKGFGDSVSDMRMILRNRHGQESVREMRIKTLEVKNDGDKSLSIFDSPRDVKGTAFLTFTHKTDDDDQWLYLPALKRVKRINSRNKSGSFMGSEFAYEDFSSQEIDKYNYRWIRNESLGGEECFVVEFYPVDKKNSGYSRMLNWIDTSEYRTRKVKFYDRKDSLLKTLIISNFSKYLDRHWRAHDMNMVNHQNGKNTTLTWTGYEFKTGLSDNDFSKNSLARAR